ncbi:type I restriction enzyme S subunit [Pontibacter ummariensis]|uniref:Type I restriction enzyme, S subunit n=1 Tax=Pontibacter ummariensis TaxID=1610492 RepID=A0A239KG82_9BACT|nr:restriction endonuclease subunit S [Pontibacter ummariensis]PRY06434.1 type I restriction enzyme S subunit [Pontibacter ummariensis]SNT17171.1 type I restriction enzyme, S subunit [Pontibacter ummariensis]
MYKIPKLPEGWTATTLEEIITDSKIGLVKSSKEQNSNGQGVPYVKMNNIDTSGNVHLYNDIAYVNVSSEEAEKYNLEEGDLLLNTRNSFELVGKTGIVKNASIPRVYNNNLLRLRFKNYVDPTFINYQINSPHFKEILLKGKKATTNICALYQKDIFPLPIILPPLSEQQEIVAKIEELFCELENGKEQLETALKQLKVYRRAVLKWAFDGRFTNTVIKDGKMPDGWRNVNMVEVAESLDNRRKPINKEERLKRHGDIPYYGANGRTGWIDDYLFDEPLILVVEDETFVGRELPFSYKITGKSWVNNHAHILKPKKGLNIDFLNYQLAYYPFLPLTTGTTGRKKLTKNALMNAPFKICSLEQQNQIVQEIESRLSVCDKVEEIITKGIQQAETLQQSILKQAFEGKLVTTGKAKCTIEQLQNEASKVGQFQISFE